MPTPTKGPRLGAGPAHERLMLANLATALFEHGRITTTLAKAKRLRPLADRLVTFAKRGDVHARRQVLTVVRDKDVVHTLFAEIGPRFASRQGGYTRITKLGPRKGDAAPMAVIELVEAQTIGQQAVGEAEAARGTRFARRRRPTGATAEAAAELAGESATAAAVAAEAAEAEVEESIESVDTDSVDTESVDTESVEAAAVEADTETAEVAGVIETPEAETEAEAVEVTGVIEEPAAEATADGDESTDVGLDVMGDEGDTTEE